MLISGHASCLIIHFTSLHCLVLKIAIVRLDMRYNTNSAEAMVCTPASLSLLNFLICLQLVPNDNFIENISSGFLACFSACHLKVRLLTWISFLIFFMPELLVWMSGWVLWSNFFSYDIIFVFQFSPILRFFRLLSLISTSNDSGFFSFFYSSLFPVYAFLNNFHISLMFCIQMNQNGFVECLSPSLRLQSVSI